MAEIKDLSKFFRLVKVPQCCNYVGIGPNGRKHYCLTQGDCKLGRNEFCKWFDRAVVRYRTHKDLALEWDELYHKFEPITSKLCGCGTRFEPGSNRQTECPKCHKESRRKKVKTNVRKHRAK